MLQQSDCWKCVVDDVNYVVGEVIGKCYVEKYFDVKIKECVDEMVRNIIVVFVKCIDVLVWMLLQIKVSVKVKVVGLIVGMGYLEKWCDYIGFEICCDDLLGNVQCVELFEYQCNIVKLGKLVDYSEWVMLLQIINVMNVLLENCLVFLVVILQLLFFDGVVDDVVNYGVIGVVIGYEISYGFDNVGVLFDEIGKLYNWWIVEDLKQFNVVGDVLVVQFSSYELFLGVYVNGKLILGENIVDVVGLGIVYDVYQLLLQGKLGQILEGFILDQCFFFGFVQVWCSKSCEQVLCNLLLIDVYVLGQFCVLIVCNIDVWYLVFEVKEGQKLYLVLDKWVKVW